MQKTARKITVLTAPHWTGAFVVMSAVLSLVPFIVGFLLGLSVASDVVFGFYALISGVAADQILRRGLGLETVADFQALYLNTARENGVEFLQNAQEGANNTPGGTELTFRIVTRPVRLENLVRFLVAVEEAWPGAKVKEISRLEFREEPSFAWEATIIISIFRANSPS